MRNINLYKFESAPFIKSKKFNVFPLSEEGQKIYEGETSHVHNYIPNQLRKAKLFESYYNKNGQEEISKEGENQINPLNQNDQRNKNVVISSNGNKRRHSASSVHSMQSGRSGYSMDRAILNNNIRDNLVSKENMQMDNASVRATEQNGYNGYEMTHKSLKSHRSHKSYKSINEGKNQENEEHDNNKGNSDIQKDLFQPSVTAKHYRSTSLNSGPFSIHQMFNKMDKSKSSVDMYPPSLGNIARTLKFNPFNKENLKNFRRHSESFRFQDNDFSHVFVNKLKELDSKANRDIFSRNQTKKNFFLNRTTKNYDGFDCFNIPKVGRCSTASVEKGKNEKDFQLYKKNYQKLLTSIMSKSGLKSALDNMGNDEVINKICEEENQNLKKVAKTQSKIPIPIKLEQPRVSNIHVGPKIILSRGNLLKSKSVVAPVQEQPETTHIPHVEGNTFITNLNRNNHT